MTPKRIVNLALAALGALGALAASSGASAQGEGARLVPFAEFRASLEKAELSAFAQRPGVRVRERDSFEGMRRHLLDLYAGMTVVHSFELEGGAYDCVPIEEQPAVRKMHIRQIAKAPPALPATRGEPDKDAIARAARAGGHKQAERAQQVAEVVRNDLFGHSTHCEAGAIPMRRVTLEEMTRFPTLRDFLRKGPGETAPPPLGNLKRTDRNIPPCTGPSCLHKYSVFDQTVANWGGNSTINVWSPPVNTGAGEDFSLTQHWYVGGSGTSLPGLQTVEVGWQNYPNKYGDQRSRLFIYHTADGYNTTGCYNLDCGDFVQVNGGVYLGGGFTHYSTTGGGQWEFAIQVQFYQGNWWIFYGNTPFGYYPGSQFHGGQLTSNATHVQYGTESTGTTQWPPEGGGALPSLGWAQAAYQHNVFYIDTSAHGIWASLSPWNVAPCYGLNGPLAGSNDWTVYFYDGGPGGSGC